MTARTSRPPANLIRWKQAAGDKGKQMTTNILTWHNPIKNGHVKDCAVSDEQSKLTTDYILANWYTTTAAAEVMDVTIIHIARLARDGEITARRIAGRWYIQPDEARAWRKSQRKPPTNSSDD